MADKEYIERGEAILAVTRDGCTANVVGVLFHMPAADVVSRDVLEQVKWERDVAMQQLEEHGIPFGGKCDVQALRHGRWLHKDGEMYCSECGNNALMDEVYYESLYCPDCGAKMDGGRKEQT